jgi:hypothetical protein
VGDILEVEASMHAPYDRPHNSSNRTEPKSRVPFLMVAAFVAVVLALAIAQPKSSIWISQAVQAEFGGSGIADDMPVETVREPGLDIPLRTVGAY